MFLLHLFIISFLAYTFLHIVLHFSSHFPIVCVQYTFALLWDVLFNLASIFLTRLMHRTKEKYTVLLFPYFPLFLGRVTCCRFRRRLIKENFKKSLYKNIKTLSSKLWSITHEGRQIILRSEALYFTQNILISKHR